MAYILGFVTCKGWGCSKIFKNTRENREKARREGWKGEGHRRWCPEHDPESEILARHGIHE